MFRLICTRTIPAQIAGGASITVGAMTAQQRSLSFEDVDPGTILSWAVTAYQGRVALSSSFGVESAGLLHMATRVAPDLPVIFLNTGFLFDETLRFVEDLQKRLDLNIREFRPAPDQIEEARADLASQGAYSETCCERVKVSLMRQALQGVDCWIAGLRRDQGPSRKRIGVVESRGGGRLKVHPLAAWETSRLHAYILANNLPFHPLWHRGYTSVGCEPCTARPVPGMGDRSGRWCGTGKTECGIHTRRLG